MTIKERLRRFGAAGVLLATLTLLLAGCLKLDMALTVSSDDTVSGSMIFAFQKSLIEATGQDSQSLVDESVKIDDGLKGVTAEPYEEGDYSGAKYTFDAVPLDEFNKSSKEDGGLVIERVGDNFVVSGEMDLATGDTTGMEGMEAFSSADIKIAITFPGEVSDTNGQVSGNTVTWVPKMGEKLTFEATAKATSGSSSMMLLIIGGVVLLVIIVVIVVLASRGKKAPAGGAAGFEAPAAPAADVPEAPTAPEVPEASAAPEVPPAPEAPTDGGPPPA